MWSKWQVMFCQMLLCACSVSLSFQIPANEELWNDMVSGGEQNLTAQVFPISQEIDLEKDPMFDGRNSHLGQSHQDTESFTGKNLLKTKLSVVRIPKMPQTLQMDDPLVQSPSVVVPQRRLEMDRPKAAESDGSGKPPGQYFQGPHPPTPAVRAQKPQPYTSRRPLIGFVNDPLVQRPGVLVPQRPLETDLPKAAESDGSGKPPGQYFQGPHPPTPAVHAQKPQRYTSRRPLNGLVNDPLVQRPGVLVPQRPLETDLPKAAESDGSGKPPGRYFQGPHPPTPTVRAQKPQPYTSRRPLNGLVNDPLVQSPGVLVPQRPLDVNQKSDGLGKWPGQSYEGPHLQKPQPRTRPLWQHSTQTWQSPSQDPQRPQQTAVKPLQMDHMVKLQQPVTPQSVNAVCGENSLQLTVKMDFLGTGHLINPADITLGGCGPTGLDESQQELLFVTPLHECGGTAQMFEDAVVYTFSLMYVPRPIGDSPIVKTNNAAVSIECHYARLHNVSSYAVRPTWTPFQASQMSADRLGFSLILMTDNWQYERPSTKYFLGDMINIEASVQVEKHVPLRIFVDECVAAIQPERPSGTSYVLIEKHGCLSDSKLMASRSQFMPRAQDEKLQMQIEAFRFADEDHDSFYITCTLRAVLAAGATESGYKACHYSMETDRWNSADGNDGVCSCCNAERCPIRVARAAKEIKRCQVKLGPITVEEKAIQMTLSEE